MVRRTSIKMSLILSDFKQLEIIRQLLANNTNMLFHENPSDSTRDVLCGRMNRHTEANSRF